MSIEIYFNELLRNIIEEDRNLTQSQLLKLYGLYKQSIKGDNNSPQPHFSDFKEFLIWEEWSKHKGKSSDVTKNEFIQYYNLIIMT